METPICVIGTGYVGMACTIGFAELGWSVSGYDIAHDRIERLARGICPYREHGIESLLARNLAEGRVRFFTSLRDAARDAQIIIVAVGTPAREDGSADVSALYAAMHALSDIDFGGRRPTIVVRSTVPPGTSDLLNEIVGAWADLVYAPEFLREGSAVYDFMHPDRIVVGCLAPDDAVPYVRLLEALERPVVFTSRTNAELIKCASNAFLALKISFANEVANLCGPLGADADDVLRAVGYDRRIGSEFLQPGIGFGGPCFEKDVKSIDFVASTHNTGAELFAATLRTNEAQPNRIIALLEAEIGDLAGRHIGIWGLAFKAGTDDVRDSLALRIVHELAARGAQTTIYDPAIHVAPLPSGSRLVQEPLAATCAEALMVLTEWPEFAAIDPFLIATNVETRVVIDGKNVLDAQRASAAGLVYRGVGRVALPAEEEMELARAV